MIDYDSFSRCHLTDIFFTFHAGAKELSLSCRTNKAIAIFFDIIGVLDLLSYQLQLLVSEPGHAVKVVESWRSCGSNRLKRCLIYFCQKFKTTLRFFEFYKNLVFLTRTTEHGQRVVAK